MTGNSDELLTTAEIRENYIDSDSMLKEQYDAQYAQFDRWLTAHDAALTENALGFIDQSLYANEDSGEEVVWRNSEVLELLADIRRTLTTTPQERSKP